MAHSHMWPIHTPGARRPQPSHTHCTTLPTWQPHFHCTSTTLAPHLHHTCTTLAPHFHDTSATLVTHFHHTCNTLAQVWHRRCLGARIRRPGSHSLPAFDGATAHADCLQLRQLPMLLLMLTQLRNQLMLLMKSLLSRSRPHRWGGVREYLRQPTRGERAPRRERARERMESQ